MSPKRCCPSNAPILFLEPLSTLIRVGRPGSAFSHLAEAAVARRRFSHVMGLPLASGTTLEVACVFLHISAVSILSNLLLEELASLEQQVNSLEEIYKSPVVNSSFFCRSQSRIRWSRSIYWTIGEVGNLPSKRTHIFSHHLIYALV